MNKNKLLSKKIILALIILLLLGALSYSSVLKKLPIIGNGTYGWETYTDNNFGYEFNHPKDRAIMGYDNPESVVIGPKNNVSTNIFVMSNPKGLPIKDWLNEKPINDPGYQTMRNQINEKLEGDYYGSTYTEKKIIINGIEGIDETLIWHGIPKRRSVILPISKKIYAFSPAPLEGNEEYDTFNKILSTFKFTEK